MLLYTMHFPSFLPIPWYLRSYGVMNKGGTLESVVVRNRHRTYKMMGLESALTCGFVLISKVLES
jgi:hypothetical protein